MHFYVFCGFVKLKVLNLQSFYHLQNLHLHFFYRFSRNMLIYSGLQIQISIFALA